MLHWKAVSAACLLFLAAAASAETTERRPDTGVLHGQSFLPELDAVCGLGSAMSEGCDAIRKREIVDASSEPWSAVGRVNFAGIQVRQHCTGTLVSERVVLTAAHCLYNFPRKRWIPPENVIFAAGYQRGSALASSRVKRFILNPAEDTAGRDFRSAPESDWALLVLEVPIGRETGFIDVLQPDGSEMQPSDVRLAGYAGLRPNVLSVASDCGEPLPGPSSILLQKCSAMRGDSGAPLLAFKDGRPSVAGVFSSMTPKAPGYASVSVPSSAFFDAWARGVRE